MEGICLLWCLDDNDVGILRFFSMAVQYTNVSVIAKSLCH